MSVEIKVLKAVWREVVFGIVISSFKGFGAKFKVLGVVFGEKREGVL